jgi:hypothetical protein
MHKSPIQLKQLLVIVTLLVISGFCLQVQAASPSDYRLQKVVSSPTQKTQSNTSVAQNPTTTAVKAISSGSPDYLTRTLLALVICGLAFVLFAPGRMIRKGIPLEDPIGSSPTPIDNDDENTPEIVDDYMTSMDAEDEIEQQLDAEEELDSIDLKTERHNRSRDNKHTNRVTNRRRR